MLKPLLAAALSVFCVTPVLAQDIGGRYAVNGTNFDGSRYSGEAAITVTSQTTCRIEWNTGGQISRGICMRNNDAFAASYALGKSIGLVVYRIQPDGSMQGVWTIAGENGSGKEILTRK
jgi:hypothetical protein